MCIRHESNEIIIMAQRSIAVIGTICCDEVRRPGRKPVTGYGGIYYSLITLAQLFDRNDLIYPICSVGEEEYSALIHEIKHYPAIKHDRISRYPGPNNRVVLEYYSQEERREFSTYLPKQFTCSDMVPLPDVGLVLLNFVSGKEMSYKTVCALKRRMNVPLYIDLHSIFLGFGNNGERYYRTGKKWTHWHRSGDILQMNSTEAQILAGEELNGPSRVETFGKYLVDQGASVVLITEGHKGSVVVWEKESKTFVKRIPAYISEKSVDPTGCGDIYSSAFAYRFGDGADPAEAADFASRVSGIRAGMSSSSELSLVRSTLQHKGLL